MGKRGPAKTPTAILQKRGNPHLKQRREVEANFAPCECPRPDGIDGLAAVAWDFYAPLLNNAGVTAQSDWIALEALCRCYAEVHEAREQCAGLKKVLIDQSGKSYTNPWFRILSDTEKRLQKWLANFGLTPATRPDIHIMTPKAKTIKAIT